MVSAHQQLIGVIDPAKGIRRSTQIGMMLFDQFPKGLLDRLLGGARLQTQH